MRQNRVGGDIGTVCFDKLDFLSVEKPHPGPDRCDGSVARSEVSGKTP